VAEAGALVEPHRGELAIAGFEAQDRESGGACLGLEACQERVGHALPARFGPDVHALHRWLRDEIDSEDRR
jgi:hypothetical protein